MTMKRRDFLKYSGAGLATVVLGGCVHMLPEAAQGGPKLKCLRDPVLKFVITDTMKEMITHNAINDARCYFWIYKSLVPDLPAECPGPIIFAVEGETISITVTNSLDEPHAFFVPGMFDSGPIMPGQTISSQFTAGRAGTHLYYDNLNAPVNRVMGLHGAFIVMPATVMAGHKFTPYDAPTPAVQKLFDDFGSAFHTPGLAWEQGDPATDTPPFRQYIWVLHEASSRLFSQVGDFTPGMDFPADEFLNAFLNDPFVPNGKNRKPEFFTISGQSGHFSHDSPYICPMNRVGEPVIIRILNAGLNVHSLHMHANHYFMTSLNGVVQENVLWLDTFTVHSLDVCDFTVPYMRPPDVPNIRGIGRADRPLLSQGNPAIPGSLPHPIWPPVEELNTFLPPRGTKAGLIDISVRISPQCYPMHDHSEATQTAQGGNYNNGMISGLDFTGDRNTPGGVTTYPGRPTLHGPDFRNGTVAPAKPFVFGGK